MRKRKGLLIAASTVTASAMVLAGCAASDENQSGEETTDISMTIWSANEDVIAAYEAMADDFRESNPELGEFEVQSIPFDSYLARVTTQLSGGDAPSIGWLTDSMIPGLLQAGALVDVLPTMQATEGYNYEDLLPNLTAVVDTGDALYGYPFSNNAQPIIFNKTMFEEAGLETPAELAARGEWTWDALRESAAGLVDAGVATYGFNIPQFNYASINQLNVLLNGFDAQPWPGGTECGYNSPEAVNAMEFLRGMIFEDQSFPGPGDQASFPAGDTGMYVGAPSTLADLAEVDFEYDLAPQPTSPSGGGGLLGQAVLTAFSAGDNTDLASRLLVHISNEENAGTLQSFFPPSRGALQTADRITASNPAISAEVAELALIGGLETARSIDYPVAILQLDTAITPVMDELWQPSADVQDILNRVCETAQPILDQQ